MMTASPSYIMEQKRIGYTLWRFWKDGVGVGEVVFVFFLYRITHWVVKEHVTT